MWAAWTHFSPFDKKCTAPPRRLPWQAAGDERAGAHSEYHVSRYAAAAKNILSWRPCDTSSGAAVVVLGDSYADDVDMGFECWPSRLSRLLGGACINVAVGGSRTSHARGQLARADDFLGANGHAASHPPGERHLVVHTGGNDILTALWFPPLLLLLWLDLIHLTIATRGWLHTPAAPRYNSFIGIISRHTARQLTLLLRDAHARGYRRVVLTRLPLSPAMPLARALASLLLLGSLSAPVSAPTSGIISPSLRWFTPCASR